MVIRFSSYLPKPIHPFLQVIAAYETSTATLRKVLAHPSLQMSHVDATMDALADALADQLEIDEAIQSGGKAAVSAGTVPSADFDDDELARELEELIKDEEKQQESESRLSGSKDVEAGSGRTSLKEAAQKTATTTKEASPPSDEL